MTKTVRATPATPGADAPIWHEAGEAEAVFRLTVEHLQPGSAGEVVLFNDSAFRNVVLEGVSGPVERGNVKSHVTAEGVDVSGFQFLRFTDGMVVFHNADTRIEFDGR